MSKLLAVRHVSCETLGTIRDVLESAAITINEILPFTGHPVPKEMGDAGGLIVMGGPMGVYEQSAYPFLSDEVRLIENALEEEKPVLGVCLGSQLLASALGALVTKGNKKEIGWHSIKLTAAARSDPLWTGVASPFTAYHWHGDVFELPKGAVSLASSNLTQVQAFRYGASAYGFLFHMEVTDAIIREMVQTFAGELSAERLDGAGIVSKVESCLPELQKTGARVFSRWAELLDRVAS